MGGGRGGSVLLGESGRGKGGVLLGEWEGEGVYC